MNVMNRKMFRGRAARDKLNKMGGIMASSQPLMQTVQQFNLGGRVQPRQFLPYGNVQIPPLEKSLIGMPISNIPSKIADYFGAGRSDEKKVVNAPSQAMPPPSQTTPPAFIEEKYPSKGTRTISMEEQGMGEGVLPNYGVMRAPTETMEEQGIGTGVVIDYKQVSSNKLPPPPKITETSALLEPITVGEEMKKYAEDLMKTDASDIEKNDRILEMLGEKEEGKQISLKERYDTLSKVFQEVLGEDPEENRKIDGYNLAMMGFMIAAGDSPNALTNIARGAAQGAERMQLTAEKRRERARKIKELGLTQAIQDDRTALQYEREEERWRKGELMGWLKSRVESKEADKRLGIQLASQLAQLQTKINTDILIANNKALNDDRRAEAERRANQDLLIIKGLQDPNVGSLATSQLLSEGVTLNDPQFSTLLTDRVRTLVKDPEIVAALRIGASSGSKGALDPSRQFQVITGKEGTMEPLIRIAEEQLAEELGRNPTEGEAYNRALILAQQQAATGQISGGPVTQRVQLD